MNRDSKFNSMQLPDIGAQTPSIVFQAPPAPHGAPMRVLINNIGPVVVLLAFDQGTLINTPAFANTYRLRIDESESFVLQPGQAIFAASIGLGGELSVAASVAIPTKWMES